MKKLLALLLGVPAVFAQAENPTPMQLVWSIFAVAVIVFLFAAYHQHLEHVNKNVKKKL